MKKTLYKTQYNKLLFGVCNGIAEYTRIDPSLARIIFVLVTFTNLRFGLLSYFILSLILPTKKY